MGAKTNYAENQIIDWLFRNKGVTPPVNFYIALGVSSAGKHTASTAYALNDTVFIEQDNANWGFYKCTTAGSTAASKPSYPGAYNEVITDGTAQFTELHNGLEDMSEFVEVSAGEYARVVVTLNASNWYSTQGDTATTSSGTSGQTSNVNAITFPAPTSDWGTVGLFAIFSSATSSTQPWFVGALTTPIAITNGMTSVQFLPGQLQYTEDS